MKLQSKRIYLFWGLTLIAGLTAFFCLIPFQTALVFYTENTDHLEAYLPLDEGDQFQFIFTHSIHLTDVVETYVITDIHEIKQTEIVYEEFGIGMPSNAQPGEEFVYEDGKYHIKNLSNTFPFIKIRNGKTVSENRLVWGRNQEHFVWFNEYFDPGSWFTVKVENLTLWQAAKGAKIHD